jgi:serine-type D-Ala-D-Ala carboxypeptidase/endopeptidase (penicillin-binding protein 4)
VAASRGTVRATLVLALFLVLVAGGVATWRYDLLDGLRDDPAGTGDLQDPVTVAPPPGLGLPSVTAPDPVADAAAPGRLDPAAVRRALAPYLRDPDLGRRVLAAVAPLGSAGDPVLLGAGTAIPASTTKVVTSAAALLALGPERVFSTTARLGAVDGARGRLSLVGGGDPYLERAPLTPDGEEWPYPERADLATLAVATAAELDERGVRRVRLTYDDTLFTGPAVNPTWEPGYLPDEVTPTSALWVDQGRTVARDGRVADPSLEAAETFASALRAAGVAVAGEPAAAPATAGSTVVAEVEGAPLAHVVQRLLEVSDNDASEVLLRHLGLAGSGTGSIDAGRRAVRSELAEVGVRLGASTFLDGSGLSRANRAEPALLLRVLRLAADPGRPELRAVVQGLPVAGFTGSLAARMDAGPPAGLGRVRAKTGTLTGVTSLAGLGTDLEGTPFAFVLMADRVAEDDGLDGRQALDSAAAALGACRCTA